MTPEELDEARAREALRIWDEEDGVSDEGHAVIAARLAREGWTPPDPGDPDVWAFLEWWGSEDGNADPKHAYLAGARMAREQERERARPLVECCVNIQQFSGWADGQRAAQALAKYREAL